MISSSNHFTPLRDFIAREFAENIGFESLLSHLEAAHGAYQAPKKCTLKLPGRGVDTLLLLIYEAVVQIDGGEAGLGHETETAIRRAGAFRDAYSDKIIDQLTSSTSGPFRLEVDKKDLLTLLDFLHKMIVLYRLKKARFSDDMISLKDLLYLYSLIRMQYNV